jgi:hypothetical protein
VEVENQCPESFFLNLWAAIAEKKFIVETTLVRLKRFGSRASSNATQVLLFDLRLCSP